MISDLGSSVNTCVEVKDEMHRKLDELYFWPFLIFTLITNNILWHYDHWETKSNHNTFTKIKKLLNWKWNVMVFILLEILILKQCAIMKSPCPFSTVINIEFIYYIHELYLWSTLVHFIVVFDTEFSPPISMLWMCDVSYIIFYTCWLCNVYKPTFYLLLCLSIRCMLA